MEWGQGGDRTAVLVHGLTGDAGVWFAVGPALADKGFHVVAVTLPGHGFREAPAPLTVESLVQAVLDQAPHAPDVAIGHSLGGYTLGHALQRLSPAVAVFEDPVLDLQSAAETLATYPAQRHWSLEQVHSAYPEWVDGAHEAKWRALQGWDPGVVDHLGDPDAFPVLELGPADRPTLFVLADPSTLVPPAAASLLVALGHGVVTVAGAGHSVHHDHFEQFMAAVDSATADGAPRL